MNYDGPERRHDDLRDDINLLADQVRSLDETIRTAFVRREELEDQYPDFEVMYARMDVLEERVTAETRRNLLRAVGTLVLVVALAAAAMWAVGATQTDQRETERIEADLAVCERMNGLRRQIVGAMESNEQLWRNVVASISAGGDASESRQRFLLDVNAHLQNYRAARARITLTDCEAVTPGASRR